MPLDLDRLLLDHGDQLNFFQAMRLLEKALQGRVELGTGAALELEGVRIETRNSLGFPGGDISGIRPPKPFGAERDDLERSQGKDELEIAGAAGKSLESLLKENGRPVRMLVNFMGLYGVSSPMPSYFIDPITLRRLDYFELKKFLDIFGHRIYSLFYRSWKKYRLSTTLSGKPIDQATLRMLALTGQWPNPGNQEFDLRRIRYARYFGSRVRSAQGLSQLIRGYFGFSAVKVRSFLRRTMDVPRKAILGSPLSLLGGGMRLGYRMESFTQAFVVEIGPVESPIFARFFEENGNPSAENESLRKPLKGLIESYMRDPLDYEIRVLLRADPSRPPELGSPEARLGAGAWLGNRPTETVDLRFT